MKTIFNPLAPEEQAKTRQDILHSAYKAMEARDHGVKAVPVFLKECIEKRIWEKPRTFSSGNTVEPTSFHEFVHGRYPMGIDSNYEQVEQLLAGRIELADLWSELTGRELPKAPGLPIDSISVQDRRKRPADTSRVERLASSIKELGLLNPITVTPEHVLIAGLHRLEACRSLGWTSIPARVEALDELHRELAEIDENLIRFELSALERSEHLARRQELYEAIHPETKAGVAGGKAGGRGRDKIANEMISFANDTAKQMGVTPRTVQQDVQIAKSLSDEDRDSIRGTTIENSKTDLLQLAREKDDGVRQKLVEQVKSGGAKSIREARKAIGEQSAEEPTPHPAAGPPNPEQWWECPVCESEYNLDSAYKHGWIERGYCEVCHGTAPPVEDQDPFIPEAAAHRAIVAIDAELQGWPPLDPLDALIDSIEAKLRHLKAENLRRRSAPDPSPTTGNDGGAAA